MSTHFIGGKWQAGEGSELTSHCPASCEVIWQGLEASLGQVNAAVAVAVRAFEAWSLTSLKDRMAIIEKYQSLLVEHKVALAELISQETGKPLWDAMGEVGAMAGKIAISAKAYDERTGSRESVTGLLRSKLSHRPHGVMAVFGPYNFPGHLPNGHIVPALMAGNTVVFKPSEQTPAVAELMVRLWQESGLPDGVLNLVQGARDAGIALASSDAINGLLFTGSAETGRAIARQLADRPEIIQALEMGGNNALIVHKVDDLDAAATLTILSAFITSGQRCTCARRLIVPAGAEGDAFISALLQAMERIRVGAWDDDVPPFMGPVISTEAAQAVMDAQAKLLVKGGMLLKPVTCLSRGDAFLSPGLMDVTNIENRLDEEIFGPLLQLIRTETFEDAVEEAGNTRFGLAAGLLSDDRACYDYFYPRVRAGIVNWNQQLTGAASTAPFGGPGWSGNHRPSAYYAADYCAYPVASIEQAENKVAVTAPPVGLDLNYDANS